MTSVKESEPREDLREFAANLFESLKRSDQRIKGGLYLRGLLSDEPRKSMYPMARLLGVDHQGLQQFITSSTWDLTPVRARLARYAHDSCQPVAWAIGDTGFLKGGSASPCVARQRFGPTGRTANCQVGASVQLISEHGSAAVSWRLLVPCSWDDRLARGEAEAVTIGRLRQRCGIPDSARHRPRWATAVHMVDELLSWGMQPPLIVVNESYGDNDGFRTAMERRGLAYVVQSDSVRRSARPVPGGPGVDAGAEPGAPKELKPAALSSVRARAEAGFHELKEEHGLDHFEGRSWIGWHRHVTLASAAQAFLAGSRHHR